MELNTEKEPESVIDYNALEHYDDVSKWWGLYYDGDPFPKECLPETGVIVTHKGRPAGVAFIYLTNAKMVHIHFAMADPGLGAGRRIKILRAAIGGAIEKAKEALDGNGFIWCCTDNAVVARIYGENKMFCPGEADVYFLPVGNQCQKFLE